MIIQKVFCFLLVLLAINARSQDKPTEISIQFISNETIGEVNFEKEPFYAYAKTFTAAIHDLFAKSTTPQDVLITQTFHKNSNPDIEVYSRAALSEDERKKIVSKLKKLKGVKSKYIDYSLLYIVKIKGGYADGKAPFTPAFEPPLSKSQAAFKEADLKKKHALLREWAITEAIPVLAAFESKVEDKFEGVKAIGKIMSETDFSKKQDVNALTEKNGKYWRAVLEMESGNQLIPVSKICMHVSQGEFDIAKLYTEAVYFFSDPKTVANYFMEELNWRLELFNEAYNKQIDKGVTYHDAGDFDNAIKVYEEGLKIFPHSAWTNYELYFSKNTRDVAANKLTQEDRTDWDLAKKVIYAANPMYEMDVRASNAREGYLLYRRQQMQSLFRDKDNYGKDFLEYADIGLDLEVYGFAAHLYWMILTSLEKDVYGDRNLVAYYLYCLEHLGETEMKNNFKGDYSIEFGKIKSEREELMKNNPFYNAFQDKK